MIIDQYMDVRRISQFSPIPQAEWQVPLPHISSWVHAGKQSKVWVTNQGLFNQNTQNIINNPKNMTKYSIFHLNDRDRNLDQSVSSFQYHLWT